MNELTNLAPFTATIEQLGVNFEDIIPTIREGGVQDIWEEFFPESCTIPPLLNTLALCEQYPFKRDYGHESETTYYSTAPDFEAIVNFRNTDWAYAPIEYLDWDGVYAQPHILKHYVNPFYNEKTKAWEYIFALGPNEPLRMWSMPDADFRCYGCSATSRDDASCAYDIAMLLPMAAEVAVTICDYNRFTTSQIALITMASILGLLLVVLCCMMMRSHQKLRKSAGSKKKTGPNVVLYQQRPQNTGHKKKKSKKTKIDSSSSTLEVYIPVQNASV